MASKRDKQLARAKAQAQKKRQQEKAIAPPSPVPSAASPAVPVDAAPVEAFKPLLLTMAQLGQLLNVSRSTLYRMEKDGQLPGRVQVGGQVRYHLETVEEWLRAQVRRDHEQP